MLPIGSVNELQLRETESTITVDQNLVTVEVRSAGPMGNGLFAIRDIPRGTRILAELPILALSTCSQEDLDIPAFCTELQHLARADVKKLDELYCDTTHVTIKAREKVRQWYRDQRIADTNNIPLKGKRLQDIAKATVKRFAIFLTNRVEMGVGGVYGGGIFPLYSRINHSCTPNAHNAYNPNIERLTVHSIRNIRAGEQIEVSYFDSACQTKQQRSLMTQNWGFACSCPACTEPSMDVSRQRMSELDQRLASYESPIGRLMKLDMTPMGRMFAAKIPTTVSEALHDAEELSRLLKEQGLEGMELCKTYRDCSKYSLENESFEAAMNYAVKELEIERSIIGMETDHLRDGMNGAEYWLMHLEQMRGNKIAYDSDPRPT